LLRREREKYLALSAAASSIRSDLRDAIAGLLLQAQLALVEPGIAPQLAERLHLLLELASNLRQRLDQPERPVTKPMMRPPLRHTTPGIHAASVSQ